MKKGDVVTIKGYEHRSDLRRFVINQIFICDDSGEKFASLIACNLEGQIGNIHSVPLHCLSLIEEKPKE